MLKSLQGYSKKKSMVDRSPHRKRGQIVKSSADFKKLELATLSQLDSCILHPSSRIKTVWSIFIAVLLVYTATVMPVGMAFIEGRDYDVWWFIDIFLDSTFFLDIIVNFNSAYYDKSSKLIASRKYIARNYLKGWFIIDLIACLPMNLLASNSKEDYGNLLRLARLPRLSRLLRIAKFLKVLKHTRNSTFFEKLEEFFSLKTSVFSLIKFILLNILLIHLVACSWYYLARLREFSEDTWVFRLGYMDDSIGRKYLLCVYWTITTLGGIGYGDIRAFNSLERVAAILWMLCGLFILTFAVSKLSAMISSVNNKETLLFEKLMVIDEFVDESQLKNKLRLKLKQSVIFSTEKFGASLHDKEGLVTSLPKHLQSEVARAMHQGAINEIPFFSAKHHVFIAYVVPLLKSVKYMKGNRIYEQNEYAEEMYFLAKGHVYYTIGKKNSDITVGIVDISDSYFGEVEVILEKPRTFHALANTNVEVLAMSKGLLKDVFQQFGDIANEMKKLAIRRESTYLSNRKHLLAIKQLKGSAELNSMSQEEINIYIEQEARKQIAPIEDQDKINWEKIHRDLKEIENTLYEIDRLRLRTKHLLISTQALVSGTFE